MADIGHEKTDDIIDELEKKIRKEYEQANKEVQQKVDNYFARFKVKDAKKQAEVLAGTLSQKDYEEWRYGQMCVGERWKDLKDQLAKDYVNVNNIARSTAEGYAPEVYALNHNFAAYQVQHDAKMDISWTLYNREAVEYLMRDDPQLLPFLGTHSPTAEKLRERMDLLWNRQHINSAITQGILQGEPIPKIAKRLERVTNMNTAAAVRNARTMMTSAENKGRQDAYNRLKEKGIDLQEVWMATLDGRTRHSHRALHGTYKDPKSGEYANGLRYPGDPMGEPEEIYNCRCCEIAEVEGVKVGAPNYSPDMDKMTFDEWLKGGSGHPTWVEEAVPPIQMRRYLNFTDYANTLPDSKKQEFQSMLIQEAISSGKYDVNGYWQDYVFGRERNDKLNAFVEGKEYVEANTAEQINWRERFDKLGIREMLRIMPKEDREKLQQAFKADADSRNMFYGEYLTRLQNGKIENEEVFKLMDQLTTDEMFSNPGAMMMLGRLSESNIASIPLTKIQESKSFDQFVKDVGGGDKTSGSCVSLSMCYAANEAGYDVRDFRGGESRDFFARNCNNLAKMGGDSSVIIKTDKPVKDTMELLKTIDTDRDYMLGAGKHMAIVRKHEDGSMEYLELQSAYSNGWADLNGKVLNKRFGAPKSSKYLYETELIPVDEIIENPRFAEVCSYINTDIGAQKKGLSGYER